MDQMVGYCGICCDECKVFLASRRDDNQLREELSALWKRDFDQQIPAAEFTCDGCLSAGDHLFEYCRECEIRKCARESGVTSCAYCGQYPCRTLDGFLREASESQERLNRIKSALLPESGSSWS